MLVLLLGIFLPLGLEFGCTLLKVLLEVPLLLHLKVINEVSLRLEVVLKDRLKLVAAVFKSADGIVMAHEHFGCECLEAVRFWVFFHVFAKQGVNISPCYLLLWACHIHVAVLGIVGLTRIVAPVIAHALRLRS